MIRFARLLDGLGQTPSRTLKLALLADYFRQTPDPDRGWALAALTGRLAFPAARPALLRGLIAGRMDADLFALSYDFVGDLAETIALVWPEPHGGKSGASDLSSPSADLPLAEVIAGLSDGDRRRLAALLAGWLDRLDATGRWALLKLVTGGLRVGVSARLALTALADAFDRDVTLVEACWHGLTAPYAPLFGWLEDVSAPLPVDADQPVFRPVMLAHPLEEGDRLVLDPAGYAAEWKWDGIRVQLVGLAGRLLLYTRTGEDISAAFPDLLDGLAWQGVADGELLAGSPQAVGSFNDLQQRLNRRSVSAALMRDYPVFLRLYDLLLSPAADGSLTDWRGQAWWRRRAALEALPLPGGRTDLSPLVTFCGWEDLAGLRDAPPDAAIEGLMLKRRDSAYVPGRVRGLWFKWKRQPLTADCVLMYAQRGHGKRSSYYSDFTLGCWQEGALVPVGKAYSGFTDAELLTLDRWVRNNTVNRFGPVREVAPGLVVELAFDGVARSRRHKSGIALRFPRFHRIRWDKPAAEADGVGVFDQWLEPQPPEGGQG
jgi:DNA ligase-1